MSKLLFKQVYFVIVASLTFTFAACDRDPIEPGDFSYPIELAAEVKGSIVHLSWHEVRVSTFEEYIIVRSQEPIDDTPEPEVDGLSVIAARIDDLTVTTFEDSGAPLATEFYYKVFAKIGERFIYSPTVHVEIDLQLISLRTDNFAVDTDENVIIGYDRSLRVLFIYDYQNSEVLRQQQPGTIYNNPIIRHGAYQGKEEIYISDHDNYIHILDRSNFQQWNQIYSTSDIHDFQYMDGYFFATRNQTAGGMAMFDRSTLFLTDADNSITQFFRLVGISDSGGAQKVYEFGNTHVSRFQVNSGSIESDRTVHESNAISQTQVAYAPVLGHFAFSNNGKIYDEDLNVVATLDDGVVFHQVLAFAPDGSALFTVSFELNSTTIRSYDPTDEYAFIGKRNISYTPILLFADEGYLYAVGMVFINNTTRTVITKEEY
jgi:hypothetical protein